MTTRTYGTFPRTISCIMVAVALIMLAGPVWAQNGASEHCPDGLRTVDLSQRPDLSCADLEGADLKGASLRGANLRGANLMWADLREAILYGADLRWADLRAADLIGADLRAANLNFAILIEADLTGADLSGATYNAYTMLPSDFDPVAAGIILQE